MDEPLSNSSSKEIPAVAHAHTHGDVLESLFSKHQAQHHKRHGGSNAFFAQLRWQLDELLQQQHAELTAHLDEWFAAADGIDGHSEPNADKSQVAISEAVNCVEGGSSPLRQSRCTNFVVDNNGFPVVIDADDASDLGRDQASFSRSAKVSKILGRMRMGLSDVLRRDWRNHDHISRRSQEDFVAHSSCLRRIVKGAPYEFMVMAIVLLNAAFIGIEIQLRAVANGKDPDSIVLEVVDYIFCVFFLMELIARVLVEGMGFLQPPDYLWNLFDTVIVFAMVVELAAQMASSDASELDQVSTLRLLRICRMFRVLRVLKILRGFRELRVMLASILASFKPLFWVCLVLLLMLYIFGLSLTSGVLDYLAEIKGWESTETEFLRFYFGTLDRSILSLFEAMTGGISWGELAHALEAVSTFHLFVFVGFILVSILGVVNVVTGVFVECALGNSKKDADSIIEEELAAKQEFLAKLRGLFEEMDTDNSGSVTLEEFEIVVNDERMTAYLDALGLDIPDVQKVFVLLDRERRGEVLIDEFLQGCLRLKGYATSLDIAQVEMESKWMLQNIDELVETVGKMRSEQVTMTRVLEDLVTRRGGRTMTLSRRLGTNNALRVTVTESIESKSAPVKIPDISV